MRKTVVGLAVLAFLMIAVVSAMAEEQALLKVGDNAPDFSVKTIDGTEFKLSEALPENPVLLVFIRGFS
jgi:hypothetical protein